MEPSLWPDILDRVVHLSGSLGAIVFEWRSDGDARRLRPAWLSSYYDPDLIIDYVDRNEGREATDQDRFERAFLSRNYLDSDEVNLVCEEVLYADEAEYFRQAHVRELLSYGIAHRYGCLLNKDNPDRARFTIQRTAKAGRFGDGELRALTPLLDHCAKAMEMARQIESAKVERQALLAGLNAASGVGICLVDGRGRVVTCNDEFRRHRADLRAFRGGERERLAMSDPADDRKLADLMTGAMNHGRHGARPRREAVISETAERDSVVCVDVAPLPRSEEMGSSRLDGALIVSRDTTRPVAIDLALAARTFALTAAEAEVMAMICDGLTSAEIAERRGVSAHTVNVQVKEILRKADARCRPEINSRTKLVRLLSNFAAPAGLADAA